MASVQLKRASGLATLESTILVKASRRLAAAAQFVPERPALTWYAFDDRFPG
jgi:hypothetical protein